GPSEVWPPADSQQLFVLPVIRIHGAGIDKMWKISGRPLSSWMRQSSEEGAVVMGRPHLVLEVRRDGRDLSLGRNVVGRMPGTDPDLRDEYIVIGAHYDHVGRGVSPGLSRGGTVGEIHNGADDNASGVAALLEVAEAYALNRLKTRRTLLFVAFDAEELGLHGSNAFVADGGYDAGSIAGMVNMDMISRNQERVVKVGRRASDESLGQIIYEMAKLLELQIDETGMDSVLQRSDQAPFLQQGIPSVFFFGGFHEDYHTPSDDVEDVIPAKLQNVARLAFLTSWGLAQAQDADPARGDTEADSD
ncbi:MAG: M20/M25/M40 family metallo-hydrolase, partial [Planctomycetota bacterium]|nr:M20/M25/M40 family metallo-hydrolase [Planctomycetota bacterium]